MVSQEEWDRWQLNWKKILNNNVKLRNIREKRAFELKLRENEFHKTQEIIDADKTGQTTLKVLRSLIKPKMVFYVNLNGEYWWRLSPLGWAYKIEKEVYEEATA